MSVEFLYAACDTRFGLKVRTSDPARFVQRLYKAKRETHYPDFATLGFVIIGEEEVWIVKKGASSGPEES